MSSSFLGNNFIDQLNEPECAEQSLRDRQLRTLFETALDGMAIADDQGRYLEVNPAACELFGLEREQLLGRCIYEFAEPGFDFQQAWQEFQQQEKVRGEFRLVRPDGEIRVVEYAATANFLPHRHLSVMRDITNCQKAEAKVQELTRQLAQTQAQLREAEINSLSIATPAEYHYLEQIVRHIPGVIYQFRMRPDGTFHFPYSSEGMREIYGVSPEEVREDATAVFQHLHPEDIDHVSQSIFASAEQLTPWYCEYRVCLPNEELIWLLGYSTPQREADGSTVWHGYIRDITESKNRELALHESEAKFSTIFHTSPDPAWIATLTEGRCLNVNENLCQFLETTYKEIIGKTCVEIGLWDDIKDLHHFRQTLIQEGRIQNFEVVIRTSSRQAKTVLMSAKVERLDGQDCVIGMMKDISQRQQAEAALRQSESRFQRIAISSPGIIYIIVHRLDHSEYFEYISSAVAEIFEVSVEQVMENPNVFFQLFHPDDITRFSEAVDRSIETLQPFQEEWRIITPNGKLKWIQANGRPERRENGETAWYGIMLDISEHKAAQLELEQFFSVALDLLCIADFSGHFRRLNRAWETILGYSTKELEGQHFLDFVHPDDIASTLEVMSGLSEQKPVLQFTNRYRAKDGNYHYIEWRSFPCGDLIYAAARDITERKQAEIENWQMQNFLNSIIDNIPNMLFVKDAENLQFLRFNKAGEELLGYPREAFLGKSDADFFPPEEAQFFIAKDREVLAQGKILDIPEERIQTSHQGTRILHTRKIPIIDELGNSKYLLGISEDITEFKQSQAKLIEITQLQQAILDGANYTIISTDTNGIIKTFNAAAERLLGYSSAELVNKLTPAIIHDLEEVKKRATELTIELGQPISPGFEVFVAKARLGIIDEHEWSYIRKDGSRFPVQLCITALWDQKGVITGFLGIAQDITARKETETQLNEISERLSLALKSGGIGCWEWDIVQNTLLWDDRMYELYGVTKNSDDRLPYDIWSQGLHPDDRDASEKLLSQAVLGQAEFDPEFRVVHPDGSIHFIKAFGLVRRDAKGNPQKMIGVNLDISSRKEAELNLRQNEQKYHQILDAITDMVLVKGPKSRIVWANKAFRDYYALTNEQLTDMIDAPFNEPDYTLQYIRDDAYVFETGQSLQIEEPVTRYDGKVQIFNTIKSVIRNEAGEKILTVGVCRDISDRKQSEDALRASEEKLRSLFDLCPVGISLNDMQGHFLEVNSAAETIYGYSLEELNQLSYWDLTPKKYADQEASQLELINTTGRYGPYQKEYIRKDGSLLPVELRGVLVTNNDGNKYICSIIVDLTDRQRQEQALRLIVEGTAAKIGEEFFKSCVQYLAQVLEVRYAVISEFVDSENSLVKTLAFWAGDDFCDNFTYSLVGTPCKNVASHTEVCRYPNSVQHLFPEDDYLVVIEAESYAGLSIIDTAGNYLGLLTVLDTKPMVKDLEMQSAILKIFATRAGAEIERIKAEAAVRQSEIQLRQQTQELEAILKKLQNTQTQLIQAEKMSSLGQLVAGVAHEINNPVSFIYSNIKPATDYASDLIELIHLYQKYYPNPPQTISAFTDHIDFEYLVSDFSKLLASMQNGATRIRDIVKSLRTFSRLDEADLKPIDIHENIESTLVILQNRLNGRAGKPEINLIKNYGKLPLVECYGGLLNQVFINLLVNAIDAIEQQRESVETPHCRVPTEKLDDFGRITIATSLTSENYVFISIKDNGCGISPQVQEKIFNPFFTTKPIGKGTGMGLAISYQIVTENHQGHLRCFSTLGQGTEFRIELPIGQEK